LKKTAAAARQKRREKQAAEKTQKETRKEEALHRLLIDLQLSNESKAAAKNSGRNPENLNIKFLLLIIILRLLRSQWLKRSKSLLEETEDNCVNRSAYLIINYS
jgi:hypothetical protein